MKIICLTLVLCFLGTHLRSQNLDNIGGTPFVLSGNISVGSSFYQAVNRDNRRSPYSYYISANPTFSIYGIDIPISLMYRDQQGSISNPFNRVSINPTYKWISLQLGKTSYNMHNFVLSGQLINGVGMALTPGNLTLSAARGKLENPLAQLDTLVAGAQLLETYEREALAVKIGYGTSSNYFHLTGFRAKDDINSADRNIINERLVKPEENIVLGTSLGISPVSWFSVKANIAASAHTANQESQDVFTSRDIDKIKADYGEYITLNFSSKIQFAGDASFDFNWRNFGFGGEYKRVDPLYKSLGTYYFLEDYENILGKVKIHLFKNRIRFNARGGIQRNNLNNLRSVTNTRQILHANIMMRISQGLSLNAKYANFQTDRSPGLVMVNDSLRVARTNETYGVSPRFAFGDPNRRSSISLSANYQNLEDQLNEVETGQSIENYNGNITYSISMKKSGTRLSASVIGNQNRINKNDRTRIGGNVRYGKSLLDKKIKINTTIGYLQNYLNDESDGRSITARIGLDYRKKKKYTASLRFNYLNRDGSQSFQEYRANVKFTYLLPQKTKID